MKRKCYIKGHGFFLIFLVSFAVLFPLSDIFAESLAKRNIDHSQLAEGPLGLKSPVGASLTGAASFSYPIDLPEFRIPFSLSLNYNSGSPTDPGGEFGAGWRLSLPEISRDIRGTPEDPSDDWFYYDGQRLLPIGDNQYQTVQSDPGRRFVLIEGQWWEVTLPDGTKMVFPWPTLFPGQNYPVKWRLGWIEDKLGNMVGINYLLHSDPRVASGYTDYRLQMIGYSGEPYGDVVVWFSTEDKPVEPGGAEEYLLTHERPITYRVNEIWVGRSDYAGPRREQRARYVIEYEQSRGTWGRSRIKRISHYGSDDAAKPRVTEFTYGGLNPTGISGGELLNYAYEGFDVRNVIGHHTGDFNLDGMTDYLTWEASGNIKFVDGNDACVNADNFCTPPILAEPWLHISGAWPLNGSGGWSRTPDINGDGRPDLAIITSGYAPGGALNPRKIYFWLNGAVLGQNLLGPGILKDDPYPNFNPNVDINGTYSDEFSFVDLNGDGRPDLLWIGVNGAFLRWARSRYPENFSPQPLHSNSFDKFSDLTGFNYSFRSLEGDFNGDGRIDLLTDKYVYLSQVNVRTSFISQPWTYDLGGRDRRRLMVTDVDQDGFDDLVWFTGSEKDYGCQIRVDVARNTGRGFGPFETWGETWVHGQRALSICRGIQDNYSGQPNLSVRDEDNDGDLDFVIIGPGSDAAWQIILYNTFADGNTNQDLLTQINLPTGGVISLQYRQAPSAWGGGLTPERPLRAGSLGYRSVLSSVTVYDGLATRGKTTYSYANGYYDAVTKEFRGFEKVSKTFSDGTAQSTWYHVINSDTNYFRRYDGLAGNVADEVFTGEDGLVYLWNSFDYEVSQDQGTGVFTTRLTEKVVGTCHQDNPYDRLSSKTAFQWTDYGAIKQTDHYGYDGKIRRSTVCKYAENKEDWIVNKPYQKSTYDDAGKLLIQETYIYDQQAVGAPPTKGLLTKKTAEDMTVQGLVLQDSSPLATTSYEYDPYGNRTKEVSPEGQITTWDYSGNGYLFPYTKSVQVGGKTLTTTTVYDLVIGKLKSETDPNGHTIDYRYESFGRVKKVIRPGDTEESPTVLHAYFDAPVPNYVERTIKLDAGKQTVGKEYIDGLGRFIGRLTGELGGKWVYSEMTTYDGNGRKKMVWEPFFNTNVVYRQTTYTYGDNKLRAIRHPDGKETSYYYPKNGVRITNERGIVTEQIRDAFGNLLQVTLDKGGSKEQTAFYQYDALDHLLQSKDPRGLVTEYKYDAYGRLRGVNAPDTTTSRRNGYEVWYDYDGDGNPIYTWKGSHAVKNEYDALGRLTKSSIRHNKVSPFRTEIVNTYDDPALSQNSLGRLAKSEVNSDLLDGTAWYRYDYDARGRVLNQEVQLDDQRFTLSYTYDSADHLLTQTDPRGETLSYSYNNLGQLNTSFQETAIRYGGNEIVKAFGYNPKGQTTDIYYGHGLHAKNVYHERGWMTATKDAGGSNLFEINYDSHDGTGNLMHVVGRLDAHGFDYSYGYDNLGRLETVSGTAGQQALDLTFAYDASGNFFLQKGLDGATHYYETYPGMNRLKRITPDKALYYHDSGHLSSIKDEAKGTLTSFMYDARDRLAYAQGPDKSVTLYAYGPQGQKMRTTHGAQTHWYIYDALGRIISTYDSSAGWTTFIYGNGQRLARVDHSGQIQYFHNDYLGSTRMITQGPAQVFKVFEKPKPIAQIGVPGSTNSSTLRKLLDQSARRFCEERGFKDFIGYDTTSLQGGVYSYWSGNRWSTSGGNGISFMQNLVCQPDWSEIDVVWYQDYLPFGGYLAGTSGGNPFAFTGKELDAERGQYDYGARWYDPAVGRFIQLDSYLGDVTNPQTLNRYAYVLNNPLRYVDPTGNQAKKAWWQISMDRQWGWGPSPAEMWEQMYQTAPADRTSVDQKLEKTAEAKRHPVWNDLDWAAREIDSYLSQWDQLSQQDKNGLLNDINTYGQTLQEQSEKNLAQGRSLADPKVRANLERWSTFRSLEDRAQGEVNQDLLRAWRQVGWVFVGPYYLNLMRGAFKVPAGFPPGTTFRKYEPPPPITKTEQLY